MTTTATGTNKLARDDTVRLRLGDLPVVAKVTNTVRQRYVNLSAIKKAPTKWDIARLSLVMLLASMPILGISVDVFGLVPQNVTSIIVIALCAVLGALIAFAPHRMDIFVGRGLIAGMVACIVYDAARLFAVHVLGRSSRRRADATAANGPGRHCSRRHRPGGPFAPTRRSPTGRSVRRPGTSCLGQNCLDRRSHVVAPGNLETVGAGAGSTQR